MLSSSLINHFLEEQLTGWEQAERSYQALKEVQTKALDFEGFTIRVQFNPARIVSSAAKVDAQSIKERKCFLCPENLPKEQKDIRYDSEYHVLVNPFPILNYHFTVPTYAHVDQRIFTRIAAMLTLSEQLTEHTLFYNGPYSGASAPDHAHFQAGEREFLPIEKEISSFYGARLTSTDQTAIYPIENYLRNGFYIRSTNIQEATAAFQSIYSLLEIKEGNDEPMMNVLTWYSDGTWHCCLFPREVHRPACYFATGDENILISPASVDLGGVFITPLEKDFQKITADDIRQILKEVCLPDKQFRILIEQVKELTII